MIPFATFLLVSGASLHYVARMKYILTNLAVFILLLVGCTTPTYEDGTSRESSDIPWNTPAPWEGSIGIPGINGYD